MGKSLFTWSTCRAARNVALARANWTCEHVDFFGYRCLEFINLDAHHLTYERLGKELPEDLIILCRKHHIEAHGH